MGKFGNNINMKLILVDKKVLNLASVIKILKACQLWDQKKKSHFLEVKSKLNLCQWNNIIKWIQHHNHSATINSKIEVTLNHQ